MYPNFQYGSPEDDIAVLRITEQLDVSSTPWGAICIPDVVKTDEYADMPALSIGFGTVGANGNYSEHLQQAVSSVWQQSKCAKGSTVDVSATMICWGSRDAGKSACTGDRGGPLAVRLGKRWTLIGVNSFHYEFYAEDETCERSIFTRVSEYSKWMWDQVETWSPY